MSASEVGLSEEELLDFSEERYKVTRLLRSALEQAPERPAVRNRAKETADRNPGSVRSELGNVHCDVQKNDPRRVRSGNMVILGRGGQVILKDMAGVLHVRIEATLGARVMRVQEHRRISVAEAERLTRSYDEAADAYLKRYYDVDLANPLNYHLVINSGKWGSRPRPRSLSNALSNLKKDLAFNR
jgi:cytidylate kinase